ncbi:MAG: hypothetical protein SGPRY_006747, partial [Prymnesium sp.]
MGSLKRMVRPQSHRKLRLRDKLARWHEFIATNRRVKLFHEEARALASQFLLFRGLARLASERNRLHRRHGWLRSLIAAALRRAIAVWRLHLSQTRRYKTLRALSASTRGLACFRAWGTRARGGRGVREVAGRASRVFERAAVRRATYAWARRADSRARFLLTLRLSLAHLLYASLSRWRAELLETKGRQAMTTLSLAFVRRRRREVGLGRWVSAMVIYKIREGHE